MNSSFPEYPIIKEYFHQNYSLVYSYTDKLEDSFIKNNSDYVKSFENIFSIEPIYFKWKNYNFPVFIHQNEKKLYTKDGNISFDIFLNTFLFLSAWQEIICNKKDEHNRFPYKESLQKKYKFTEIPVVNIYFELLYEVSLKNGNNVLKKKFKNPFILTHDIDQLRSAWFENIQYELNNFSFKSVFIILNQIFRKFFHLKDSYFLAMERMLNIDEENNVNATSFLMPMKSHKDADFEIGDKEFKKIINNTCNKQTIGIHPGYDTYNNKDEYSKQIKKLEKIANKKITKSRQHFLRYDINSTPYIQEELKIEEDYTLGFAEHYGFRNAIANQFYLFNFKEQKAFDITQIPLVFMDVSLLHYSIDKEFDSVLNFLETIKNDFNINFSILFHNSVFAKGKYDGFEALYLKIVELNKK